MTSSYPMKHHDYWTFGAGYEEYEIKVYCYVKQICGVRNHSFFTVTPIYPIFSPMKTYLLVAAGSPDSITKGRVCDKVCISLASDLCWVFQMLS